jgi:membrane protein implicated in regulation of membrane protease activity
MTWWGWMILGAVLFGAELFAIDAQFFLVFLGLSAFLVGVLDLVGITMPESLQWTVFAALSLVSMFTFRKALYEKIRGGAPGFHASMEGEEIKIEVDLEPGRDTRADFRGTKWTIINVGSATIKSGSRARVVKTDGLVLHVSAN